MTDTALHDFAIWVLLPSLDTDDPNLQYYYDFEPALAEYKRAFLELGCDWQWRSVSLHGISQVLDEIQILSGSKVPLVLNLCDGDETNGVPGVSVVRELERRAFCYTGAREYFYEITTSKIPMKEAFDKAAVQTAAWRVIHDESSLEGIFDTCGTPLIVKPAVSGGSMGLSIRNVVSNMEELHAILQELHAGYRGWNLEQGGIFAERFIQGPEFTTFIVGSGDQLSFYAPAERVFHDSLKVNERFLSFDRLWETYETESAMPDNGFVYTYAKVDDSLFPELKALSIRAYKAVEGSGYGRIDIRQDAESGELFVLEVNAQCGLSEDENYTSIGAILRFEKQNFAALTRAILEDAINAYGQKLEQKSERKLHSQLSSQL